MFRQLSYTLISSHQGCMKLPKAAWTSSKVGGGWGTICPHCLVKSELICKNMDGQLPTLPTHHLRPCTLIILNFPPVELSCNNFLSVARAVKV